jgi:signal transduction histidine kinase
VWAKQRYGDHVQLDVFLAENRGEIIARCAVKVAARRTPKLTDADIERGIPLFLDHLIDTLRRNLVRSPDQAGDATRHGRDLMDDGFTVGQVVHTYGDVCQSVTDLAVERQAPITPEDFRVLNRCLDEAIADAVTEFSHARDRKLASGLAAQGNERFGMLAHEVRNLITSVSLTFDVVKSGSVGVAGATGTMLERLLGRLGALVDRSIAEARLEAVNVQRERVDMRQLFEELEVAASLSAKAKGVTFAVTLPTESNLAVNADPQILLAVVVNLVQNAIKFTRPNGSVALTARAAAERVLIDITDECGGLPPGGAEALFQPFEQRATDRSGLGLGLMIARRGAEANGGRIRVRDLPGTGCTFTVDLPRAD